MPQDGLVRIPPRIVLLMILVAGLTAIFALRPSSASAYSQSFCNGVYLASGQTCVSPWGDFWTQIVASAPSSTVRVCAGGKNADGSNAASFVCGDDFAIRKTSGSFFYYGAIHNGSPSPHNNFSGVEST
jgi:hypothetical protein